MGEARRKRLLYGPPVKTPKPPKPVSPLEALSTSTKLLSRDELNVLVTRVFEDIALEEGLTEGAAFASPEEIEVCFQEEAHLNRTTALGQCGCGSTGSPSCFVDPE